MTLLPCRVRVERGGPLAATVEMTSRLLEPERVLEGYRRLADTERTARLEETLAAKDEETVRLRAELARREVAVAQLTEVVGTLDGGRQ